MGAYCCTIKSDAVKRRFQDRRGSETQSVNDEQYSKAAPRNRQMSQPTIYHKYDSTGFMERRLEYRYHSETRIDSDEDEKREQLEKWLRHQPLSRRKLDRSDRHIAMLGDERDNIQKKTFTKWVNKHLSKTGGKVDDLFKDLQDGFKLIALLEALTGERLSRENGYTRFHRIQNVQYCLDFLRKKNIKLVNIRPEDIVEGNGKLTLGLIWTIILNFQVSVIKQRQHEEQMQQSQHRLNTSASQVSDVLHGSDATSARDALLQWARKVTAGYPRVNVTNFSSSWKDGLAFNAILHRYRPNLIDWNKISDPSVSNRERLDNAFAAAEKEFGVDRLLDAQDVDTENPDEKSIITYVSSLYNALPHLPELSKSNLNDLISRLTRGIGITNEKLDLILQRIEDVESRVDTSRPGEVERLVNGIIEDLNNLESPISGFFEDVEELKTHNHPEANDFYRQVYGLHQRRTAYLDRLTNQLLVRLGIRTENLRKENAARLESIRTSTFSRVEECIEWVRSRLEKLTEMEFLEDLETLEEMFEQHKLDNRDIQDFRQNVDECIARQAEVSAEDTYEYCELLRVLESEYQQLRDLSAGRMLDLDSLIAFVRAAQMELVWVSEREEIEVTRNWSDIKQLDLPMLTNYYKQLLHEMELREKQYNDVHNQGAALLNQGHPAVHVIEVYLRTMQNQWDWLLALSKCLEEHLRDALNLKSFMEEASDAENWIEEQAQRLENNYNRTDFSLEEGERYLRELDEIKEILNKYHSVLMALTERCATISPLWQRGERISRPITVIALCDYTDKNLHIKAGDDVTLLDNSDLIKWQVRDLSGTEGTVPSVVFRIPPPDSKLTAYLNRLLQQFEKLKKLWDKKHRMVRFNMVLNTMKTIQGWDLDTFNNIDPEQRDAIMRALNDDANKLLSELDPNDPLALRLKEELRRTNEHFWNLLNASQKPPEPDYSSQFDDKIGELLRKLEEAWRKLNDNVGKPVSRTPEELEKVIIDHKQFEDALQALDADVANVKELFRQLPNPTPTQRVNNDRLNSLWEDLWDLSRMYVERIKVLESVLNGMIEVADIVRAHEITLNSFDDLPAALDKLRGHHSQLLEMNMVLQQQQTVIDALNKNVALLRQHVARTRIDQSSHPDVDRIEDEVQQLNVRWENVGAQVAERLRAAERALQTQMVYRSEYENEMAWLDRVEDTINKLRKPEDLRPEEYQHQLDLLVAEYAQLQERTEAIENVNREGGKFIREAKGYDSRMGQFRDTVVGIHGSPIQHEFRRTKPQPKNGAQIVTEELEALNRRFAQLSSLILERRNTMQVLIQNWKRQKQIDLDGKLNRLTTEAHQFVADQTKLLEVDAEELNYKDRVQAKLADVNSYWLRATREIGICGEDLKKISDADVKKHVDNVISDLERKFNGLCENLTVIDARLEEKNNAVNRLYDKTLRLTNDINALYADISDMEPIGRSQEKLTKQLLKCEEINKQILGKENEVETIVAEWNRTLEDGIVNQSQWEPNRMTIDGAKNVVGKARNKVIQRTRNIQQIRDDTRKLESNATTLMGELRIIGSSDVLKSTAAVSDPREHFEKLKQLKDSLKPIEDRIDNFVADCRLLIKTAGPETDTTELNNSLESVSNVWSLVSATIAEREIGIDAVVQQMGRYEDAHKALLNWLEETEEIMENQRPPASDAKVSKAQLHAYDVLLKHIEDKQASMKAFSSLIDSMTELNEDEKKSVKQKDQDVWKRYNNLLSGAQDRQARLMDAVDLAERLAEEIFPLDAWLTQTEKRLTILATVPTDTEKVDIKMREQKHIEEEITEKGKDVDQVLTIVPMLCALVKVEDAEELETQSNQLSRRYNSLAERNEKMRKLLADMAVQVQDFVQDANNLSTWLDDVEQELFEINELAIEPSDLIEQTNILSELAVAVAERDILVSNVMEVGRELCRQAIGDEAMALQNKIETLKLRYIDVMLVTDNKLAMLTKAIPLSEKFHEGFHAVMQWLEAVEEDLAQIDETDIETQAQLIFTMEEDIVKWRPEIDDLVAVSTQLQALSSPERAEELFQNTVEMNRRVNHIADKVARRAERMDVAEKQSRNVHNELDYLVEWLADARERVITAGPPSIDPEYVKAQLKNQLIMNEDVTANKTRLREMIAEAKNISRQIDSEYGKATLIERCDQGKELIDEVASLCMDRTECLERALALAQQLTQEFEKLTSWVDQVDNELRSAPEITTATPPVHLKRMHDHNTELTGAIIAYKPLMDQFEEDVKALREICIEEDGVKLGELAEEIVTKYHEVRDAVRARGQALDSTLDFTSGLGERLDTFVQNLQGSTERLKQNEMISSDPAVLENRIAEIQLILDNLHEKEIAYGALRDSAAELLATAPEGDVAAKDVSNKLDLLSKLWLDVELEAVNRRNFLEDVLVKAKYFWNELDQCQKAVDDLSVHLESIEPAVGQPDQLQIQQTVMHKMADDISSVEPRILGLRQAGAIFSSVISREDQAVIDSQIDVVQNGWSTITKLFTDKNRQLIVAMEEAISFHDEFAKLLTWLDRAELHLESLPAADNLKLDDIPEHLEVLHRLKDDVDQHAVIKEQLSQAAIQIAAGASAHQATAIRQPINEMNTRWTRLFASLSDKEYKVECALLQMGRLSDAVDQMIAWMNKTRATLSELEVAGPVNFRQIEIQLCKLTVITNDVQSHEPSLLALNTAVQRLIKDESNSESTKNIDQMNTKWKELKEVLENLAKQMDKARSEAENVGGEIEHWSGWLEDIEIQLTTTKPTGGLPETAESQMDDFRVLRAEVEQNKISLERYIYDTDRYLSEHGNDMESWISRNHTQIKAKWIKIKELCIDREKKLQLALEEAIALSVSMKDTTDWINSAEQKLAGMSPVSRLKGPLTKQIEEYEQWMEEVAIRKQLMVEQQAAGTRLQYYCEKKDAIPIKNGLVSLKHRFEKIATRTTERSKKLNAAFEESRVWLEGLENLENWMSGIEGRILEETPHTSSVDRLKEQLETIKEVHKDITMRQPQFDITRKRGITITEHAPRSEVKQIKDRNDELMRRWNTLTQKATEKQQRAEQAVLEGGVFEEAMLKLESWVDGELEKDEMGNNEKLLGDVDTVRELIEDDQKRSAERKAKKMGVETVLRKADEMLARGVEESESVREATSRLKEKWSRVEEAADKRSILLNKAEYYASDFDYKAHALLDWLAETESKLKFRTTDLSSALATIESVKRDLNAASQKRDACVAAGKTIQDKCHPRAEQPMKYWLRVVNSRWKEVEERASEKEFTLLEEEQREKECQEAIKGLLDFVTKKRKELLEMLAQEAPQDLDTMSKMQRDHEQFEFDLRERQSEVDSAIKGAKKGLRLRSAIADQLSAEWKQLWLDSMGYQSSLEAQRDLLEEMYRLEGWKWEDWKERYVEWNDHRKARVSDLFRRIDRNHTGNVPREVFIDAILASKFPTSRLEMDKVSDLFDKGDKMISSKEFIDALRFDRTNRHQKPLTDHEKVNEEITKQKDACSCCNQFKIEKISDGHYRFGDTQIKRMVRILRSTVMVRVGGGWEALDEFLNKHDPCRAKGRLNIDMIYKDVAPSTAIDTMRAFTKGRRARPISQGTPGPIMKIREKTELSLPMFPHNRANSDVGSGFGAADPRLGRPSRTNSRNSIFDTPSRPASRNSETNDSDRPSRIPSLRGKKGIRYNLPSNLK